MVVVLAALMKMPGWRPLARLLLASALSAYLFYVAEGWEAVDGLGLLTKLVELATIALLWLPADDPRTPQVRI